MKRLDIHSLMGIKVDNDNNPQKSYHMHSGATRNIIQQPLLCSTHMHMESINT